MSCNNPCQSSEPICNKLKIVYRQSNCCKNRSIIGRHGRSNFYLFIELSFITFTFNKWNSQVRLLRHFLSKALPGNFLRLTLASCLINVEDGSRTTINSGHELKTLQSCHGQIKTVDVDGIDFLLNLSTFLILDNDFRHLQKKRKLNFMNNSF